MKIAVLGANGMLGSMLVDYLSKYFEVVATIRSRGYNPPKGVKLMYLDAIKDSDAQIAHVIKDCQWVINAIGAIPQRVEGYMRFFLINAKFPLDLIRLTRKPIIQVATDCIYSGYMRFFLINAKFPLDLIRLTRKPIIQVATDCIYSGQKGNYIETDMSVPADDYGKSKKEGEVVAPNMHHIRCSIVGPEKHGESLLGKFLNNEIRQGYTNHLWNGVTTLHFAKVCRGVIENNTSISKMQHLVPADRVSKYELLKLFAKEFKRGDIQLEPTEAPEKINRTLSTTHPEINRELWRKAGYPKPPTIAQMVRELAEYVRGK